jgi:hypothetical protein
MNLNKRQRIAALVGLAIIVIMGMFPPTTTLAKTPYGGGLLSGGGGQLYTDRGYKFIASTRYDRIRLDTLFLQWFVVSMGAAVAVVVLRDDSASKGSEL